jgi:hypothetical protein
VRLMASPAALCGRVSTPNLKKSFKKHGEAPPPTFREVVARVSAGVELCSSGNCSIGFLLLQWRTVLYIGEHCGPVLDFFHLVLRERKTLYAEI